MLFRVFYIKTTTNYTKHMERNVKFVDLEAAVTAAYEKYKSESKGEVDPRLSGVDPKLFGITVVLADGTVINKGDTKSAFPLGNLMKVPTATLLLQQNTIKELIEKSGLKDKKGCKADKGEKIECAEKKQKLCGLPISPMNLRAVSAIQPSNDPDGKMDIIVNNLTGMLGSDAVLDDKLYEIIMKQAADANEEDELAAAGFYLYDEAANAIKIAARLEALTVTTEQLATLGATLVADGFNPVTKQNVFDGAISERVIAMMAGFGPSHHKAVPWLIRAGVPAMAGFGGGALAVVPGVMAIAAYSPEVNCCGASHKALHAIRHITNQLGINVFASARVRIQ